MKYVYYSVLGFIILLLNGCNSLPTSKQSVDIPTSIETGDGSTITSSVHNVTNMIHNSMSNSKLMLSVFIVGFLFCLVLKGFEKKYFWLKYINFAIIGLYVVMMFLNV